jgi:hypothetical protein
MTKSNYEKYLPKTLQESYLASVQDPELMSLRDELALLRTLLGKYIEDAQVDEGVDEGKLRAVSGVIEKIAKTQTAISSHEARMREVIPAKMIPMMVRAIGQIIKSVIQDERAVTLIQQKILALPNMSMKMIDVEAKDNG